MKKFLATIALTFGLITGALAGDATLTWTAPTTYEDGTAILSGEIVSYKVYYGQTASGPYTLSRVVTFPNTTTTITVPKGTWYFVSTATTTNGLESSYSNEVSKVVLGNSKPRAPTLQ